MKEMISRRSFLRVMGLGFGAAMLTACKTGTTDSPADSPAASVPDADTPVPFLTEDEFPRLDGSTACIPLMAQMKADVTGMDLLEAQTSITVSTTAYAWENFGLWSRSDSEDYGAQLLIVYEAPEYVKEELAEAGAKLEQKAIGRDALVFIVNEENPVQSLTQQQLRDIYAGRITSWKDVGGADAPVVFIGREAGSGTRDGFESITGTSEACVYSQELTSTGDVIATVAGNPNAIGYASLSAVGGTVKALTVGGVQPTEATVLDGSYAIQRPFVLVTKQGEALTAAAQAFFDYALSAEAAPIVAAAGAVPVAK